MKLSDFNALAIFNENGFDTAAAQAAPFGPVATLPQIIQARLDAGENLESPAWSKYYTTASTEYVGLSRHGRPIAIVCHGGGPRPPFGVDAKDSFIDEEQFRDLEQSSDAHVVDLTEVWRGREYAFSGHAIPAQDILVDPLFRARLGPKAEEYCRFHTELALKWQAQLHRSYRDPCILAMDADNNFGYGSQAMFDYITKEVPKGKIPAFQIAIGQLIQQSGEYKGQRRESLASEVDTTRFGSGYTRVMAIQSGPPFRVHPGLPELHELVKTKLDRLWVPTYEQPPKFARLIQMGKHIFTEQPKEGDCLDTGVPEFLVRNIRRVGSAPFSTPTGAYYGWVKYGIDEVQRIAPLGANAYMCGEWTMDSGATTHYCDLTFYHVEAVAGHRLIRMDEIMSGNRMYDFLG